jgi:hypothetical protein
MKSTGDLLLKLTITVIGILPKGSKVRVPQKRGREGIDTRAEIQDIFSGFFALTLSGTAMNISLRKVNHHKTPVFFQNTLIGCLKCVLSADTSKEEGFYILMFYFDASG